MNGKLIERYGYLVVLQSECKSLVVGKSIKLTGYMTSIDAIESAILLLELIKKIEDKPEPKHETVERWEKRTGETYPDDGPVWVNYQILKENRTEWKLTTYEDIKQWDKIAFKYNTETSEMCIVANHHGKPND